MTIPTIKRKRTSPPTEGGWYYAGSWNCNQVWADRMGVVRKFNIGVVLVTEYDGRAGIWDDRMEELDPLPDYYVWFGPVPRCEEEL